ncbi:MAG: DUF1275 domain-containing protein [Elusimicrobia bacterium]|nr:DUF1275 domain-containing protein [Elusimicrobiota bacterium]
MFRYKLDEVPDRSVMLHWLLLAFNAGCINTGGFLATGRFVTHVTGFATLFGVDLQQAGAWASLQILSVPLFFLLGAMIAGLLTDRPIHLKSTPHYDYVMALCSACLFLAALAGGFDYFGVFGESFHLKHTYLLLALLCLASGLQNGAITSSSGSSVRTTHLTGLTTDLGLGFARMLTLRKGDRRRAEWLANGQRAGTVIAFILGSAAGAWLFSALRYRGFVVPGAIAVYAAWHGRRLKRPARSKEAPPEALPAGLEPRLS